MSSELVQVQCDNCGTTMFVSPGMYFGTFCGQCSTPSALSKQITEQVATPSEFVEPDPFTDKAKRCDCEKCK